MRNPIARDLREGGLYRQRIVRDRRQYNRKPKHPKKTESLND